MIVRSVTRATVCGIVVSVIPACAQQAPDGRDPTAGATASTRTAMMSAAPAAPAPTVNGAGAKDSGTSRVESWPPAISPGPTGHVFGPPPSGSSDAGAPRGSSVAKPIACGSTVCKPGSVCVEPCCGGAQPMEQPKVFSAKGKPCPAGTHAAGCGNDTPGWDADAGVGTGMSCCAADGCKPPPPFCIADITKASGPGVTGCQANTNRPGVFVCHCP